MKGNRECPPRPVGPRYPRPLGEVSFTTGKPRVVYQSPPAPPPMRMMDGAGPGRFLGPVMAVVFGVAFMLAMTGPIWIKWL